MDYHHPYNVYPEYYWPGYHGTGYPFQHGQNQSSGSGNHQQRHTMPNTQRNYNNNIIGHHNMQCPPHAQQHFYPYHQQQSQSSSQHPSYNAPPVCQSSLLYCDCIFDYLKYPFAKKKNSKKTVAARLLIFCNKRTKSNYFF